MALEVVDDLGAALRERAYRLGRDADDLRHALSRTFPLDAECPSQLEAELRLVEVAGREPVGLEQRFAVERAPCPVGAPRHVGDDHVRVQVRILRSRRSVPVRGGDEPGAAFANDAVLALARHARLTLEVAERRLPRGEVRLVDRVRDLSAAERVQQADALRRREHEVVAGDGESVFCAR